MSMKTSILATLVLATVLAVSGSALAQTGAGAAADNNQGLTNMGLALGAGLAIGLAGIATAIAQKDIGAAAVGAIAEDAAFLGRGILMVAIPETVVIFGFVVAFLLYGKIA